MSLAGQWGTLEAELPSEWDDARLRLTLEETGGADRAILLLAPLQPVRDDDRAITLRVVRRSDGAVSSGASPEALRRALLRLDSERVHGTLSTDSLETLPQAETVGAGQTLAEGWDAALATLPADWSDLLGEIELFSSDYLDPGAVQLAPINPRLVAGGDLRLQFRSARQFGYGASAGMVRRCLERCDNAGIRGRVQVLRALSDTQPVGTQGPVWQIDGRMV